MTPYCSGHADVPVDRRRLATRPEGETAWPLAENRQNLTDGSLNTTLNLTETGDYIDFDYAWTGTNHIGGKNPDTCNNWVDATQSFNGGIGRLFDRSGWTAAGYLPCDAYYVHLYCLED